MNRLLCTVVGYIKYFTHPNRACECRVLTRTLLFVGLYHIFRLFTHVHSAQLRFSPPWGHGVHATQLYFSLPCGQGLHSAQWYFCLP
jgi:hypothetical protein